MPASSNPGHGDTGSAARFFYCAKASKAERTANGTVANKHPTVKPLKLMQWLVRLVRNPERNLVLDPFMGSGTTAVACVNEGLPFIGIERDKESCDTAVARIQAALKQRGDQPKPTKAAEVVEQPVRRGGQGELF